MPIRTTLLLQQEAAICMMRAADLIQQEASHALRPFDLTGPQFNVLRILRGSPQGLACGRIGERMINRDPDITRLLDRLEARGLLERERSDEDRRVVKARISQDGLALLKQIDPVIEEFHQCQFKDMTEKQLRQLIEIITEFLNGQRSSR